MYTDISNATHHYRFLLFGLIKWIQEACEDTPDKESTWNKCRITTAILCTKHFHNYTCAIQHEKNNKNATNQSGNG